MAMIVPFPKAWYSVALKGYRDHPEPFRTYSPFPYESLPPVPEGSLDGSFKWLPPLAEAWEGDWNRFQREYPAVLARLAQEATALHLTIPQSFVKFVRSAELPRRV
jgi:hypothetical protein